MPVDSATFTNVTMTVLSDISAFNSSFTCTSFTTLTIGVTFNYSTSLGRTISFGNVSLKTSPSTIATFVPIVNVYEFNSPFTSLAGVTEKLSNFASYVISVSMSKPASIALVLSTS